MIANEDHRLNEFLGDLTVTGLSRSRDHERTLSLGKSISAALLDVWAGFRIYFQFAGV
jgi:hypothetical protein